MVGSFDPILRTALARPTGVVYHHLRASWRSVRGAMDQSAWTPGESMNRDHRRGRRLRGDRGAALVESAIVLPFLALMVFGIVELGFLFRSASVAVSATRSGARLAAANYGSTTSASDRTSVLTNVRLTVEKDLQSKATGDTPVQLWVYRAQSS